MIGSQKTVGDLIAELSRLPADARVYMDVGPFGGENNATPHAPVPETDDGGKDVILRPGEPF